MYKIVSNVAKTRGVREGRSLPLSALSRKDDDDPVDPSFQGPDDQFPGGWRMFPDDWRGIPEDRLLGRETLDHISRGAGRDAGVAGRGRTSARRVAVVLRRGV
jgi:RNA polymerase sigma-70 factor, ECF subfamily